MNKNNWQLKDIQLSFYLGSFETVANYIFKNIGNSLVVLPTSLHDCALIWSDSLLANFYDQIDICTTDGMPLVFGFRFCKKKLIERVYGPDLMAYLLKKSDSRVSHYFLGADPEIEKKLLEYLDSVFFNLKISGSSFLENNLDETKNEEQILKKIKQQAPSVLWIGLGSPKQVELAVKWTKELPKTTIICVGAAFDLLTGNNPTAPAFVKKIGFEWLFRLLSEPRRLGKRYLVKIPHFIFGYSFSVIKKFFCFDKTQ